MKKNSNPSYKELQEEVEKLKLQLCTLKSQNKVLNEEKTSAQTLQHSESKFKTLFTSIPDPVFIFEKETGVIIDVNTKVTEVYGYSREEALSMNVTDISKEPKKTKAAITNNAENIPIRYHRKKTGETIIVEITASHTNIENKEIIIATVRDITERIETEEALNKSEAIYKSIFQNAPLGIFHYNEEGILTDCNELFANLIGSPQKALIGLNMISQLKDYKLINELKKALIEGHGYYEDYYHSVTGNKTTPVQVIFKGISDDQGNISGGVGIVEDISERKKHEEVTQSVINLYSKFENTDIEGILDFGLEECVKQTESETGFLHFVSPDQKSVTFQKWSKSTLENCNYEELSEKVQHAKTGVWKECLENRKPVLHNDCSNLIKNRAFPEGHLIINRYLVVPVFEGEKIVTIIGVGNKIEEYTQHDVNHLSYLANNFWNIVRRKKAEQKLKENELFLNSIIEHIPNMIFVKDAEDLRFVRFNKAGEELLGYSSDELIGKNDYDFFPKEEADLFTSKDREVINSKKLHSIKEENISTHKGDRVLSTKKLTICDSFGKPKYLLGISEDITERKKYESELKENEERFKALSNATFEAIFISEKGICIEANKAAIEMFGYNHHELIGIFGTDVIAEESKEIVKQNMLRGFEEPYEAIAIRKDGSKFSAMFHGRMFEYKGRDVRITAIRDITLQKQNEIALKENEQLLKQQNDELVSNYLLMQSINQELEEAKEKAEESDRLKSAFLANMSHEIRTPMNGIVGFSQLMRTKKLTEDQQMKFIKIINNSSMQLLRIVNDIIDVSKIEIGKVDLNYQESNINFLLNELFAFYKPVAGRKNIKLSLQKGLNDEQSLISTDQVKVRQVLDNIISNAVKFTKDGFINFGYKHKDNNLEFYIQDSGIGIPEEQQNIVFDRFMQADSQLSETHSGTGLGLSISKSYIELLGGKIWLESESEKGTTFYFTIPYKV